MNFDFPIGNTPLLALLPNLSVKIEYTNMTGSVKDRAALAMIFAARQQGVLQPGGTVIEPTSGNMGISLAAISARLGYRCIIVMPETMSIERRKLIRAYGAQVVLTPGEQGMAGAVAKAKELAGQMPGSFVPDQFSNPANPLAHYRTTGPEIWGQTGGKVDVFVAGVGTGGTISGAARYLKEQDSRIQIVAVEPASSPLLSQGRAGAHRIQGIGANFVPPVLEQSLVDEVFPVTDEEAFSAARCLAGQGLLCGISSGAAYHAAKTIAQADPQKKVVTLLPDAGNRYLSAGLFESE